MFTITIKQCADYIRSRHPLSVCGIRGNPHQTLIARVAKFTTGHKQGFAYLGGEILHTPEGPRWLSPQVAKIAQAFEDCRTNDFDAYPEDEMGLTAGAYTQLPCGKWYREYENRSRMKAYSPDMYRRYARTNRQRKHDH